MEVVDAGGEAKVEDVSVEEPIDQEPVA